MEIYGRRAVMEALAAGRLTRAWAAEAGGDRRLDEIVEALRGAGVAVELVPRRTLDRRAPAGAVHQGVLALGAPPARAELQDCLELAVLRSEPALLLYLEGVSDPHNLGAVARSVEVAGGHGLCLRRNRSAPVTPAAIRASAGALLHLPVVEIASPRLLLEQCLHAGLQRVALQPGSGRMLWEADLRGPTLICLGGEGEGLSRLTAERCDEVVCLPQRGRVQSLNVSAAAAATLHEICRQRDWR